MQVIDKQTIRHLDLLSKSLKPGFKLLAKPNQGAKHKIDPKFVKIDVCSSTAWFRQQNQLDGYNRKKT